MSDIYKKDLRFSSARSGSNYIACGFGSLRLLPGDQEDKPGSVTALLGDVYFEDVDPLDLADYLEKAADALREMATAARGCAPGRILPPGAQA